MSGNEWKWLYCVFTSLFIHLYTIYNTIYLPQALLSYYSTPNCLPHQTLSPLLHTLIYTKNKTTNNKYTTHFIPSPSTTFLLLNSKLSSASNALTTTPNSRSPDTTRVNEWPAETETMFSQRRWAMKWVGNEWEEGKWVVKWVVNEL